MIEVISGKYFHLKNKKISYLFYIMENNQLGHLYYGEPLPSITEHDLDILSREDNKSAGTVKFSSKLNNFSLHDHFQEYPCYGTSDFKEGAIEVEENGVPLYLDFKYHDFEILKGKKRELSIPSTFGSPDEVETISIRLIDQEHELELVIKFNIFSTSSIISRSQIIRNIGKSSKTINKMLSGVLEIDNNNYDFVHLSGAWLKERSIKKHNLEQGTVSVGSLKGASGHQHNPFVALQSKKSTFENGEVYGMNLIYSGNFIAQAEVDEWNHTRMMLGIHPSHFSWDLKYNETFTTPEAIIGYSSEGLNGLSQEFSDFIENHIIDKNWLKKKRPIVFNNWEATYFDYDHEKLLSLASIGKSLGMECFVLDDGWFSRRDNDRSSLGDWYYDIKKFPKGLEVFSDDIHNLGLKFGIWFEPEMVSPDSKLYKTHPDWVVGHPYERLAVGRGQYVLDFSNPDIIENIFEQMKEVIVQTNLDYIKWDMNRNITEAYSTYLANKGIKQTEFFHRYILGVYSLYTKLLKEFPNLLIEGCAGGGGRYDLGILFYSPQIWPSDDSDAIERLKILTGTVLAYPLSTFSNHVSASLNHQTNRRTSLKTRQDVAIFGPLGYELNLEELSHAEKEDIIKTIQFYKSHQILLTSGKFYQLLDYEKNPNEVSWAVYDANKDEAIVGFYRKLSEPNNARTEFLKIPFVSEKNKYQVNNDIISGSILKRIGVKKPYQFNGANHDAAQIGGDFQSFVFYIKKVE